MTSILLLRETINATNLDAIISQLKNFSQFFPTLLISRLRFQQFQEKDDTHRLCISEITESAKRFRQSFDKQHGKRAQTLFKSKRKLHYDIY